MDGMNTKSIGDEKKTTNPIASSNGHKHPAEIKMSQEKARGDGYVCD